MQKVYRVNLVAINGIFGIGGGENKARCGRKFARNLHTCHAVHFDIEEHNVRFFFNYFLQSDARIGVSLETDIPKALAIVFDNAQRNGLVVYGYGVEHNIFLLSEGLILQLNAQFHHKSVLILSAAQRIVVGVKEVESVL